MVEHSHRRLLHLCRAQRMDRPAQHQFVVQVWKVIWFVFSFIFFRLRKSDFSRAVPCCHRFLTFGRCQDRRLGWMMPTWVLRESHLQLLLGGPRWLAQRMRWPSASNLIAMASNLRAMATNLSFLCHPVLRELGDLMAGVTVKIHGDLDTEKRSPCTKSPRSLWALLERFELPCLVQTTRLEALFVLANLSLDQYLNTGQSPAQ